MTKARDFLLLVKPQKAPNHIKVHWKVSCFSLKPRQTRFKGLLYTSKIITHILVAINIPLRTAFIMTMRFKCVEFLRNFNFFINFINMSLCSLVSFAVDFQVPFIARCNFKKCFSFPKFVKICFGYHYLLQRKSHELLRRIQCLDGMICRRILDPFDLY